MLKIFQGFVAGAPPPIFRVEDPKHAEIAAARLARQAGRPGFGNARAVRNLYEAACGRQAARVIAEQERGLQPDLMLIKRDDLLGPRDISVASSAALQELEGMLGLGMVKAGVDRLLGIVRSNVEAEEIGKPIRELTLNRVFLGNPGTGGGLVECIPHICLILTRLVHAC